LNPAGGVLISACGDGNPRVRRWQSPRAAFEISLRGVSKVLYLASIFLPLYMPFLENEALRVGGVATFLQQRS